MKENLKKVSGFLERIVGKLAGKWWILALILVLGGAGVMLRIGAEQSVWFDEDYSVMLARSGWGEMFSLTAVDAHPPLYYGLLKIWDGLGGFFGLTGDLWLRSLSVLFAAGASLVGIWFIKRQFSARAAVLAAPFVVFAPFLLRYGFEIRMYALASLITVASTFVLFEALKKKKQLMWIWYGILVAAGMWTLHFMAFVFLAHLIWLLKNHRGKEKFFQLPYIRSYLFAILLYLPYLPFAISQLIHPVAAGIGTNLGAVEVLRMLSFNFVYQPEFWLTGVSGVLVLVGIFVVVRAIIIVRKGVSGAEKSVIDLMLLIFWLPILVLMPLSLVGVRLFVERYQAPYVICFYILVGIVFAVSILRRVRFAWVSYLFMILVLVYGVFSLARYGNYNFQRMEDNRFREVASEIGGCSEEQAIVVDDILVYFEIAYYIPNCSNLYFYSPWDIEYRGGYAPVASSPQRILFDVETPRLAVVRIKNREDYAVPDWYREVRRVENFDVINIEFFERF
jgi:4-amino-4-deoxy-L-arabinose transferase-like glycosyltransferase